MLRSHLISFLCVACLTSCVNYAGIHGASHPLDNEMLKSSYSDEPTQHVKTVQAADWWHIYHDPKLNTLVAAALRDSPNLQMAKSRLATSQHIAEAAGSSLWPQLDASGSIQRERLTENTFFPPPFGGNNYTETNIGLNFNYELDFWGKNRSIIAARTNDAKAAAAEVAEARLILAAAVSSNYFQLQYELSAIKLYRDIVKQRQEMLKIVALRARHGIVSDIPMTTANADLQSALIAMTSLQQQVKLTTHELAALAGQNPFTTSIDVTPFAYRQNILRMPKSIPANLLARRPDIIAACWRMQAAASLVNASKARFYPNVNLLALWSYQSFILSKAFDSGSRDSYIGAAVDLPIFDAGRRRANLSAQYAEFDTAQEQYNQTLLNALRDTADQVAILHALNKQEHDQSYSLSAIKKNYQLTQARYKHGINDYMSVLEIQGALLNQQNAQIQLRAQQIKATVAMIKALGGNYLIIEG
jgi:NodT family efflux transporter outer membrane factor (OMF) lipoprotein